MNDRRFERAPPTAEEGFEDVGLNDEQKHQPKNRGFFAKFGSEHQDAAAAVPANSASPTLSRFQLMSGRKRGQCGQGAELGQMDRPQTATSVEAQEIQA